REDEAYGQAVGQAQDRRDVDEVVAVGAEPVHPDHGGARCGSSLHLERFEQVVGHGPGCYRSVSPAGSAMVTRQPCSRPLLDAGPTLMAPPCTSATRRANVSPSPTPPGTTPP